MSAYISSNPSWRADPHSGTVLARLLRICNQLKLSSSLQQPIYQQLNQHYGWTRTSTHYAHPAAALPPTQARHLAQNHSPSPPNDHQAPTPSHPHYSLQLKAKINQGAPWGELKPILKQWWLIEPNVALSAKILELSYVWSGATSLLEVLNWFDDLSGWQHLHAAIRDDILLKHYEQPQCSHLMAHLETAAFKPWLLGSERLITFIRAYQHKNTSLVFKLYNRFAQELKETLDKTRPKLNFTAGEFKYAVALARLEQGYVDDALHMVRTILPSESAYQLAHKLKRRILAHQNNRKQSSIHTQITTQVISPTDWPQKEQALRHYFETIRTHPSRSSAIIPTLNELLAKDALIPMDHSGSLSRYVGMCLEYFDLYEHLPNITWVLHKNAYVFHSPTIDGAIWNHFINDPSPESPFQLWQGVALFHRFIAWGPDAHNALWEAYHLMQSPHAHPDDYVIDVDFKSLKKAGLSHLSTSPIHNPTHSKIMQAMCDLCAPNHNLTASQIEGYLQTVPRPPYSILNRLWQIANARQTGELSQKIIHAMIQNNYICTNQLKYYLSTIMQSRQTDLGWRIITVLRSRAEVLPLIEQLWQVSGENRKIYHMIPFGVADLARVLTTRMNSSSWKVFCALLTMGYRIPELIAHASYRHESSRWRSPEKNTLEARILSGLSEYSWLHKPNKRVAEQAAHPYAALGIVESQHWILTPFSCCVSYLLEFLGLISLNGDLLKLNALISLTTTPDAHLTKQNPTQKSCIKWYRALSQEQRIAWLDICRIIRDKVSVDISQDILKLTIRLALIMLPAHFEAMQTLQQLKMPLVYLRDLEAFILSDAYTQFRINQNITHQVPLPAYSAGGSQLTPISTDLHQELQQAS